MNEDVLVNTTFNYYSQKKYYMLEAAKKHAKANKIGKDKYPADYCWCCNRNSNKTPFFLNCSINEFSSLGRGYSLYFKNIYYIKCYIQFILLINFFFLLASKNWDVFEINKSWILDEMNFYLIILFVFWIDYKMKIYEENLMENSLPDISDFSVMLSKVQGNNLIDLENNLRIFLNKLNNHNGITYDPYDISFCFKSDKFIEKKKRFVEIKNTILDINEKMFFFSLDKKMLLKLKTEKEKLTEEIKILNKEIEDLWAVYEKVRNGGDCKDVFTGNVLITFDDHKIALDFLEKYENEEYRLFNFILYYCHQIVKKIKKAKKRKFNRNPQQNNLKDFFIYKKKYFTFKHLYFKKKLLFKNHQIYVSKAENPHNITWKNMHYKFYFKQFRRFLVFTISSIFLICSFLLVLMINHYRYKNSKSSEKWNKINIIFNLSISSIILIFNMLLTIIIEKTIKLEVHVRKTGEVSSIIKKLIFKMFLNASLTLLVLSVREFNLSESFLFSQLIVFNIVCIVFYPIANYLDPYYFYYLFLKRSYKKKNEINITQIKLNKIFTSPKYNLIINYSVFIFFLLHLILFMPFFPMCMLISALLFYLIYYKVQKHLFVARYSSSAYFKNDLNFEILKIIKTLPLVFLIGELVKGGVYEDFDFVFSYMGIKCFLAFLIIILPHQLLKIFFTIPQHYFGYLDNFPHLLEESLYKKLNPTSSIKIEE